MQLLSTAVRHMVGMTSQEFNRTIGAIRPKLVNFAALFVKSGAATAEDMVQDAVLKLWKTQETQQIKNTEALTLHILRNLCLDYLKLKKNNTEELKPAYSALVSESPLEKLERKDGLAFIKRCIETLPEDQMIAVRLRDVLGYEIGEIATILGTTEVNVRTMLSRARNKLREKISQNGKY